MLFSRLTWPSPLARERACTAIAHLLAEPAHAPPVKVFLLLWLKAQHHESVCGLALLALLRAKIDAGGSCPIPASEVRACLPWPSVQSSLLLAEYGSDSTVPDEPGAWHSGDPPSSFTSPPFFGRHVRSFVAPVYDNSAKEIEQRMLVPFRRQWAYEWEIVLRRHPVELSVSSLRYWFGSQEADARCGAVDTPLSEIYRSSYLRALAWAVATRGMDKDVAASLAAETIPIDLELWQLRPGTRPAWWPTAAEAGSTALETAPEEIWPAVEDLWHRQQARGAPWGEDWILTQASGRVRGGETVYDLSLLACFQLAVDPEDPSIGEVFDWCAKGDDTSVTPITGSRLRFTGKVRPSRAWDMATRFGGWSVMPAVGCIDSGGALSRWQWWRGHRGLWGPASSLTRGGYTFRRDGDTLAFESDGEVIGRWCDWTDELRERIAPNILPATGQMLLTRRDVIERFASENRARFCWVVRLTAFCRERHYELYRPIHDYRTFGVSRIILPG
jgi:hypothetical protein